MAIAVGLSLPAISTAQTTGPTEPGVAVLDSGTNAPVNIAGGENFVGGAPDDLSDNTSNNHGTTSSLIVNDQAPGIPQYIYKVTFNNEDNPGPTDAAILTAAANPSVKVLALSNTFVDGPSSTIATASNLGKFISIPSGNKDGLNPDALALTSFSLPGVVIVTGTNGGGTILEGIQYCGVTRDRCVAAVGTTEFNSIFGTSFASANIGGIAAEVWRRSPFLTAEELAQVLFRTAEDRGDPGVDDYYGHGFIRDAAQVINNPAGSVEMPTGDGGGGGGAAVAAAAVALGAALGVSLLKKNDKDLKKTLVLDEFGRPFTVDLTKMSFVRDTNRVSVPGFLNALDESFNTTVFGLNGQHQVALSYSTFDNQVYDVGRHFAMDGDLAYADRELNWSADFRSTRAFGLNYQVGIKQDPVYNFGAADFVAKSGDGSRISFLSGQPFSTPLLGFNQKADSAALGFTDRGGWDFNFAVVNSDDNNEYGSHSVAAILEGGLNVGDSGRLTAQFGRLNEAGSLFGGSTGGIYGVDNTTTYAMSLSAAWRMTKNVSLIGNYGVGYSSVDDSNMSLFRNFSSLRSNWWGVGLVANHLFTDRDQWGIAVSQPLRVYDGEVDMKVPYARDFDGNIYKNTNRIGLDPSGHEHTFEAYYRFRLAKATYVGAYLMYQTEPGHDSEAPPELTFLTTMRVGF